MRGKVLYVHGLSPLHPGVGQQAEDVDLPVAREVATGWPYVPGSTIKGVLRSVAGQRGMSEPQTEEAFGPPPEDAPKSAGQLLFTDARLLLLPVRSLYGTFAWVTCPLALQRLERDRGVVGGERHAVWTEEPEDDRVLTPPDTRLAKDGRVFLEDLDFAATPHSAVETLARRLAEELFAPADPWRKLFAQRLAVVSDQVFTGYAALGTEVRARVRLDEDTGTVANGALWYEELLPSETVLQGLVLVERANQAETLFPLLDRLVEAPLQLGGDASVGRGLARLRLADGR